jgi:hypothetical protein
MAAAPSVWQWRQRSRCRRRARPPAWSRLGAHLVAWDTCRRLVHPLSGPTGGSGPWSSSKCKRVRLLSAEPVTNPRPPPRHPRHSKFKSSHSLKCCPQDGDMVGPPTPPVLEPSIQRAAAVEPEMSQQSSWAAAVVADEHDHAEGSTISPVHRGEVPPMEYVGSYSAASQRLQSSSIASLKRPIDEALIQGHRNRWEPCLAC